MFHIKLCVNCGKSVPRPNKLTCSKHCQSVLELLGMEKMQYKPKKFTCRSCGKTFVTSTKVDIWYCSHSCRLDAQRTETPMKELYNCKQIDKTHYRITKFDKHLDPRFDPKGKQSSYIVSKEGCDCPQGNNPSCRHRKMLPSFIANGYVDTEYFFIWDTAQWYKPTGIFAQARKANGKQETLAPLPAGEYEVTLEAIPEGGFLVTPIQEGGPKPVSAAPSPQPSTNTYRRF